MKEKTSTLAPTDSNILPIYEKVFSTLYDKSQKNSPDGELNLQLLKFFSYKLWHWIVEDPNPVFQEGMFQGYYQKFEITNKKERFTLKPIQMDSSTPQIEYQKAVQTNFETMTATIKHHFGESASYHYHKIESKTTPRVTVGFFRVNTPTVNNPFTEEDIRLIEILKPHIILILRTVSIPYFHSQEFQYYERYMAICSTIAREHSLSDTEAKFLPEILFGYTNEQIAERNFISVATVKKHLQHIFKKTNTKNRMDFLSTFFTSPDDIKL
ncbi:MAG TPA: LuxR C-terminal-related transcriptional regulator [Candidatus Kapabacteria bacterium]|nr:LuxR C-terminal-related transcriptional regulator [Candidatus Kapabacteria bacterium]